MQLWVLSATEEGPSGVRDVLLLRETNWNDWWKYSTLYSAWYVDPSGTTRNLGMLKVGQRGMRPSPEGEPATRPTLPRQSEGFDTNTFSLGQDSEYYENVAELGAETRDAIHDVVRDIAFDLTLCERFLHEDVMGESLLREVPLHTVRGQFARLAHGGTRLTSYDFAFVSPQVEGTSVLKLDFSVRPESLPPTNIHAIIGRNGVGKSTLLNAMAHHLVRDEQSRGRFVGTDGETFTDFNNLVSVTFSAFDDFEPIQRNSDRREFGYSYIGLKDQTANDAFERAPSQLDLLLSAVSTCLFGSRKERWQRALRLLEADPIFEQTGLVSLINDQASEEVSKSVAEIFHRLSSGHKIVLISITRLVASVEEKTLVLIDEPEAHLHPPLLSAYIRALSDLLVNRNGVAIVATHSPVVLQEAPATCVWKISRAGNAMVAERPELETFGENVGTLTNEVFGLEVTATGFHKMLTDAAAEQPNYTLALAKFGDQIGVEGRAILRSRMASQRRETT